MRNTEPRDAGFTMPELVVAMVVGLLVLGVAYSAMDSARAGFQRVDSAAQENRYISSSILVWTRYARELHNIYRAEDYLIDFTADVDNDGKLDRLLYQIDADNQLTETVSDPNTGTTIGTRVLARGVRNKTDGRPMFRYWKSVGVPAVGNPAYSPPRDGERLTKTQLISFELSVHIEGGATHPPQRAKTDVFLRNRLF